MTDPTTDDLTLPEALEALASTRATARTLARQLRASHAREMETRAALAAASWRAHLWSPSTLLGNEPQP